ncbi:MAG: hypothetical protein H7330_15480 [Hymenobacteraceae bacterium]|nr:hypothetical protein [Hymenobacteraceae bacterium]
MLAAPPGSEGSVAAYHLLAIGATALLPAGSYAAEHLANTAYHLVADRADEPAPPPLPT